MPAPDLSDLINQLNQVKLRYIPDTNPGYSRKKNGKSFKYHDADGKVIGSAHTNDRINKLTIPPAWKNVWISPSRAGYLQAIGFDEKGRKQYIYHPEWILRTQQKKFDKMTFFGQVLPEIRQKVASDMNQSDLGKKQLTATIIWLLEHTFIRVGNDEYAKENSSYGLTTLRNRHVFVRGQKIKFEFKGKSGIHHSVSITHPKIAKIIKELIELPGYEIFQYLDDDNIRHTIDSADVNDYLKSLTGEDVTAKDFRTWGATVLSGDTLYHFGDFQTDDIANQNIIQTVKVVSNHLRNTPTVCRNYYIHPTIIDSYQNKILIPHFEEIFKLSKTPKDLKKEEYAVLKLLQKY